MKREGEEDGVGGTESDFDLEYNEIEEEDDDDVGGGYEFTPDAEKSGTLRSDLHVIYRRRNSHLEHSSDYRE